MLYEITLMITTALFWGATNPYIKRGGSGIEGTEGLIGKLAFLVSNFKCVLPLVINQIGSVLFFVTLQATDLSIAVPVTNSLTLTFTTLTGFFLGEQFHKRQIVGCILIVFGVCLCVLSSS